MIKHFCDLFLEGVEGHIAMKKQTKKQKNAVLEENWQLFPISDLN